MKNKEKIQEDIEDALHHEENLQQDKNKKPVTYINSDDVESIKHEDELEHDENEEPVTFVEEDNGS